MVPGLWLEVDVHWQSRHSWPRINEWRLSAMTLSVMLLLLLATVALVGLVRALVRTVQEDGHGDARPDPHQGWFAPHDIP